MDDLEEHLDAIHGTRPYYEAALFTLCSLEPYVVSPTEKRAGVESMAKAAQFANNAPDIEFARARPSARTKKRRMWPIVFLNLAEAAGSRAVALLVIGFPFPWIRGPTHPLY